MQRSERENSDKKKITHMSVKCRDVQCPPPMFPCHTRIKTHRLWGPAALQCDDRVVRLPCLPSGGRKQQAAGSLSPLIG